MPRLRTDIVVHRVPLKPECNPVRQKLRKMKPDVLIKIKEEVQKQIEAGFLTVSKYPEWMVNIVPVPKKDGKVRICVDYRDLNRASPKDNFPLPHIDMLVDNTARYSTFSFMDGFSGYNQIKMAKEIEVYVDDMIAKSKVDEDHTTTLQKLFDRLRKYQLKLNPSKCTFGATSGKLLGFIVSEEGIRVYPDKVRAIMEMSSPKTEKEIRGFLGRLNYISRFISHLTPTCEPIFKLLRKNNPGKWNEDCEEAFNKIKQYLQSPPVLIPPAQGRPLILYLTVLESFMGGVLGQHDLSGKKEHAIYYLSKKFTDYESRYSMLERTCCALVWTAHRLRQYMLYHTTCLISKMDRIKYIFEKPSLSGRIAKWQVLLSEYDIVYVTKKAIKESAVADHLAAQPVADYEPMRIDFPDENIFLVEKNARDHETWTMLFDSASNELGHGIGVVLISPEGKVLPLTAKLCFECTHNIAEYEACIMGLQVACDMSIKNLKVLGDSMLVIHQVKEEWETSDAKLVPYS
ncbi:protein NYNRIN-like [Cucumis melo var. makuwa]|uniref:Protein NYNRIN-like n=1 Tax=Cucumis melo var. makuwa TaxID=1194695 RepID=A0A5A7TU53_CUCMM|nr:protein NYNRIN-like [Cucumis melo var. makuwa]